MFLDDKIFSLSLSLSEKLIVFIFVPLSMCVKKKERKHLNTLETRKQKKILPQAEEAEEEEDDRNFANSKRSDGRSSSRSLMCKEVETRRRKVWIKEIERELRLFLFLFFHHLFFIL